MSDILKNIASKDKDAKNALKELYDIMSKDIYNFLLMFCKDKYIAEEAVQETFIAIYENAKSYRIFKNPRAWIFTIAKNKAVSIIRENSRTTSLDAFEKSTDDTDNTDNIILGKIQTDMLLSILSEKDKKIVILHVICGFKHREIAELMDMPLGTVTWRYKQSIDKMRSKNTSEVFIELNKQNEVIL